MVLVRVTQFRFKKSFASKRNRNSFASFRFSFAKPQKSFVSLRFAKKTFRFGSYAKKKFRFNLK